MRRLLLILLLTILPLQASWAAVCAYCPGPCDLESRSDAIAEVDRDHDAGALASDDDCDCCQPGSVAMAPALTAAPLLVSPPVFADDAGTRAPASRRPARPERPKWTRAAASGAP